MFINSLRVQLLNVISCIIFRFGKIKGIPFRGAQPWQWQYFKSIISLGKTSITSIIYIYKCHTVQQPLVHASIIWYSVIGMTHQSKLHHHYSYVYVYVIQLVCHYLLPPQQSDLQLQQPYPLIVCEICIIMHYNSGQSE